MGSMIHEQPIIALRVTGFAWFCTVLQTASRTQFSQQMVFVPWRILTPLWQPGDLWWDEAFIEA